MANVIGTINVLEQSARTGVKRIVFSSSGGALYGNVYHPAAESEPLKPASPYGISKLAAELYLQWYADTYDLQAVALRYANVYGPCPSPSDQAGVVAVFATSLLSGRPVTIYGDGSSARDFVFVTDVARANLLALTRQLPQRFVTVNIGTGTRTTIRELEMRLRALVSRHLSVNGQGRLVLPPPRFAPEREGELRSSILAIDRARHLLGWSPCVSLEEGLRATVEWFLLGG